MGPDPAEAQLTAREAEARALHDRFQKFPPLADPMAWPFVHALAAHGVPTAAAPLLPHRSSTAFLGASIRWRSLGIDLRQPDPSSILICHIRRLPGPQALGGPLLALGSFLRFAVRPESGLDAIGGCVSKTASSSNGELALPRLRDFYTRIVGDLHEYRDLDSAWLFGLTRRTGRYARNRIWSRPGGGDPSCLPPPAGEESARPG